ncbi:general secretion pathway protein GspK [bacterium]|nr:general secretion pathway protein GspK [bacterium]
MIIMAVLGAIVIALVIASRMAGVGLEAQQFYKYTAERENNYQMARSAVEMGFELLRADNGDTDSVNSVWAVGAVSLEWEGKNVVISVVDEESKFPLSVMQKNTNNCAFWSEALVRLFENGGLGKGEEARDQFLDWVDSDSQRRSRGAEGNDYADMIVRNSPMDSLQELFALPAWQEGPNYKTPHNVADFKELEANYNNSVSGESGSGDNNNATNTENSFLNGSNNDGGFGLEVPEAQTQGMREAADWKDFVSIYSSGKINVNTAPKDILLCLDSAMTTTIVDEIDNKRRSGAFKRVEDLRDVAGIDADLLFRIQDQLCVKSKIFTVEASVLSSPGGVKVHSVVKRDGGKIQVIYWGIE